LKFPKPSANLHAFHCHILFLHFILKGGPDRAVGFPLAVVRQVRRPAYLPPKPTPSSLFLKVSSWFLQTIFRSCLNSYPNILLLLWTLLIRLMLSLVVMLFIFQSKQKC